MAQDQPAEHDLDALRRQHREAADAVNLARHELTAWEAAHFGTDEADPTAPLTPEALEEHRILRQAEALETGRYVDAGTELAQALGLVERP